MSPRVALITRRYWPLVGGAESLMANLAAELRRQGADPTIVTAQWRGDWPPQMRHFGSPVIRLPNPKPASWGVIRYMTALSRWLRRNQERFDAVLVSRLRHDAYGATTALKDQPIPVLVRNEEAGETGDCRWLDEARFGVRIRRAVAAADMLIAPTPQIADEMFAAGFSRNRVQLIENGAAMVEPTTVAMRRAARSSLAEANHDLNANPLAPVVVVVNRFHASRGLSELVTAFRPVALAHPNAQLWLIGDGPLRDTLFRQIVDMQLHHQVFMPGVFDDLDDIFRAADVFVAPTTQQCGTYATMQAMAYGLPVVVADLPGNRRLIKSGRDGVLAPRDESGAVAWGAAIRQLLGQPAERARLGAAARETIARRSITRCAQEHLQLVEHCMQLRSAAT